MIQNISVNNCGPYNLKVDVCNKVFGCNYIDEPQKGCFIPEELRKVYGEKYHVWFPHLDDVVPPGWKNILSSNGTEISETNGDIAVVQSTYAKQKDWTFVTFVKTNGVYEFAGVFEIDPKTENGTGTVLGNTIHFKRISTNFP